MKNFRYLQQKYIVNTYPDRGLVLVKGEGVHLWDETGRKFLDMMTNYGVNIFGHNHPFLTKRLISQMETLVCLHGSFNNDMRADAAQNLVKRCGGGLAQVYFANSGAEAIEAALKFVVLATGKKKFLSCFDGYHGKTLGALSACTTEKYKTPFEPLLWDFSFIDFNNIQMLERALDVDTAALILESLQGEGGLNVPDPGYLAQARKLCESKGALLILDEIQTGLGRTGYFLASQEENISYDIVCLGKGLASGLPAGATLVSGRVAEKIPRSIHTSTFGGNPLAAAGILATLELLDKQIMAHVRAVGDYFMTRLKQLTSRMISRVKGRGLMLGLEVFGNRDRVLRALQDRNILAIPAAENVIRFLPSFILERSHVDTVIEALDEVFAELDSDEFPGKKTELQKEV